MKLSNLLSSAILALLFLLGSFSTAQAAITPAGDVTPWIPPYWDSFTSGTIGNTAGSTLTVNGGSTLYSYYGYLGYESGGSGLVTISGGSSTWSNQNYIYVGRHGTGTLNILSGGSVSTYACFLGFYTDSSGAMTVDGAGSIWTSGDNLTLGVDGTGTLNILNGGSVSVGNWTSLAPTSSINFGAGGGTLTTKTLRASPSQLLGAGTINAKGLVSDFDLLFDASAICSVPFGSGGTATINMTNSSGNGSLGVGLASASSLTIRNGAHVYSGNGYMGFNAGSSGTATVDGPGTIWTSNERIYVGNQGNGILNITNGGNLGSVLGYIGGESGSSGTATVDGPGSRWTNSGELDVGNNGSGTLNIVNNGEVFVAGTTVIGPGGVINFDSGGTLTTVTLMGSPVGLTGTGTINARGLVTDFNPVFDASAITTLPFGSGGTMTVDMRAMGTVNGALGAGYAGSSTLTIKNGAHVSSVSGYLGYNALSSGTATVDGAGSIWSNYYSFDVGSHGDGTLNITNGGTVRFFVGFGGNYFSSIGHSSGSTGLVAVNGSGSAWTSNGDRLSIGHDGSGTLSISNAGTVSGFDTNIGFNSGSMGMMTLDGAGSLCSGSLTIGSSGTGTVTQTGGTNSVGGTLYLGKNSGGQGTYNLNGGTLIINSLAKGSGTAIFNFGGGTLQAAGSLTTSLPMTLTGTGGTATVNTNGYPMTLGGILSGPGGFIKTGAGTLTLTQVNTYSGITTVDGGTLKISNGGKVNNSYGTIGSSNGTSGTVSVVGPVSTWTNRNGLIVGQYGNGVLNVLSGGQLICQSNAYLAYVPGVGGTVSVAGTGSKWTSSGSINVGNGGSGFLNIQSGGEVSSASGYVDSSSSLGSTATIDGAGSKWNAGSLYVGNLGIGVLNITSGGQVITTTSDPPWFSGYVGYNQGSTGIVNISGADSAWTTNGSLLLGFSGMGTVNQTGGIVSLGSALALGYQTGGRGTYNLDGGTLVLQRLDKVNGTAAFNFGGGTLQANGLLFSSLPMTLTGIGGDAKVHTNGFLVNLSGTLSSSGGLAKLGTGMLTLTGANTYMGKTTIAASGGSTSVVLLNSAAAQHPVFEHGGADIQAGKMIFSASGNPGLAETIRLALIDSCNGGNWDAGKLQSYTATPGLYTLGWTDGLPLESTGNPIQITVMWTLMGDADLDGVVGTSDLNTVLAYYGQSRAWKYGDADYDNLVGISDLNAVLANYGLALPSEVFIGGMGLDAAAVGTLNSYGVNAVVPEPGTLVMLLAAAMGFSICVRRNMRKLHI